MYKVILPYNPFQEAIPSENTRNIYLIIMFHPAPSHMLLSPWTQLLQGSKQSWWSISGWCQWNLTREIKCPNRDKLTCISIHYGIYGKMRKLSLILNSNSFSPLCKKLIQSVPSSYPRKDLYLGQSSTVYYWDSNPKRCQGWTKSQVIKHVYKTKQTPGVQKSFFKKKYSC